MRKKMKIFAGVVFCLAIVVAIGYYQYQKPRQSAAGATAAYTCTATDLYKQFDTNETTANTKYTGKVIAVSGSIQSVDQSGQTVSILLNAASSNGGINCMLAANDKKQVLSQGENITIKGRCTGFLADVNLVDAVIVK